MYIMRMLWYVCILDWKSDLLPQCSVNRMCENTGLSIKSRQLNSIQELAKDPLFNESFHFKYLLILTTAQLVINWAEIKRDLLGISLCLGQIFH